MENLLRKYLFNSSILSLMALSCQSQQTDNLLDAQTFYSKISDNVPVHILDVRTPEEFSSGYIKGAVNLNLYDQNFATEIEKLDKNKPYYLYCLSGGRSGQALNFMMSKGFKYVYNLQGGIMAWNAANLPLEKPLSTKNTDKISMEAYKKLTQSGPKVLVDFYAPWCAPCRKMEPDLALLAEKYKGKATIVRINVDENKNLAKDLGVNEIPVIKIYTQGKITQTYEGYMSKESLISALEK